MGRIDIFNDMFKLWIIFCGVLCYYTDFKLLILRQVIFFVLHTLKGQQTVNYLLGFFLC